MQIKICLFLLLLISISNESFSQANIAKTIGVDILENARGVSKIRQSYYLIDEVGNQLVMISDELADESLPKILSKLEKPTDRILLLAAHARADGTRQLRTKNDRVVVEILHSAGQQDSGIRRCVACANCQGC